MEARVGAFFAADGKARNTYNTPMPYLELESSYRFTPCWDMWAAVGCCFDSGRTCRTNIDKSFNMIPITLGLRRLFCIEKKVQGFLGAGVLWSSYHAKISDCERTWHQNKQAFGAIIRGGFQVDLAENFTMEFTGDYLFQYFSLRKVCLSSLQHCVGSVNMSGLKFGIGLMYNF